jgi:hypothetical protein
LQSKWEKADKLDSIEVEARIPVFTKILFVEIPSYSTTDYSMQINHKKISAHFYSYGTFGLAPQFNG